MHRYSQFKAQSIDMSFNLHDALVCTVKKKKKTILSKYTLLFKHWFHSHTLQEQPVSISSPPRSQARAIYFPF